MQGQGPFNGHEVGRPGADRARVCLRQPHGITGARGFAGAVDSRGGRQLAQPWSDLQPQPIPTRKVGFSCRLPISLGAGQGPQGEFIDFPSGRVTSDLKSPKLDSLVRPGRELHGYYVTLYFDRAYKRWLPVSRDAVSPDGAHYAYTDRPVLAQPDPLARATVHVVAVKTGVDVAFDGGDWSNPYAVLDYSAEGIYLITDTGTYVGLWLMDPTTGEVTRIADLLNVQGRADRTNFWAGWTNPSDPNPVTASAPNQLDKVNLVDGTRAPWFYRPGTSVHFVGQDVAGHPIILVGYLNSAEYVLTPAPGIIRSIFVFGDKRPALSNAIADRHGIWFGSVDGIYLYTEARGLVKVSNQPGYPSNGCI
jgi:hypothetical protein